VVEEVAPQPTPVPTPVPTPEPTPAAPIRPLWFKSNQLDPVEAESYLERTLDRHDSNQLSAAGIAGWDALRGGC